MSISKEHCLSCISQNVDHPSYMNSSSGLREGERGRFTSSSSINDRQINKKKDISPYKTFKQLPLHQASMFWVCKLTRTGRFRSHRSLASGFAERGGGRQLFRQLSDIHTLYFILQALEWDAVMVHD